MINVINVKTIFPWTTKTGLKQSAHNSFNIKKFQKYKSKIDFYYVDDLPKHNGENLEYENFIKNQFFNTKSVIK